ncbi:hypothetical protein QR680_015566 [Steinernema hermaphroditum]|uniref:G-protein coupled receptors family 1 profile domain-containing protein n=1 Tax=Steinernema hermaphroditum TaxID=289476 RepID=A0AA39LL43_9BILA|nr:hypothetical protein QR680_015566 [Steinernema hermaphroditum]
MSSAYLRTACFLNMSANERIEIFMRHRTLRLAWVYKTFLGWLSLPFSTTALALTVIYIIVIYNAIKQRRVSRKCYVLLLNRAIGDALACICAIFLAGYVLLSEEPSRDIVSILDLFFVASFWSAMISYVSLSLMKLYAVARPFQYRRMVTMKRCIYMMIASWVVFLFMVAYALTSMALVLIPTLNEWSGCKRETCLVVMYRSRSVLTSTVYFLTIFTFFITVFFIRRAQRFVDSFNRKRDRKDQVQSKTRFPLWKLALNVGTFGFLNAFYVIWGLVLLIHTDKCFWQRNVAEMFRLLGLIRITLVIRIILDPIFSFITDFQMRRGFLELLHFKSHRIATSSRKQFVNVSSANNSKRSADNDPQDPEHRGQSIKTIG